jgi:hypothetical protein
MHFDGSRSRQNAVYVHVCHHLILAFFLNHVPSFSTELPQLGLPFSHVLSVNQINYEARCLFRVGVIVPGGSTPSKARLRFREDDVAALLSTGEACGQVSWG